jgi:3-oxoadipate enol-lactonase
MPILCWIMGGGFVVKLSNLCRAGSLTSGSGPIVLLVPSTVKKGRNMAVFNLGPDDALYYEHTPPDSEQGYTFVFFNALTGATDNWEALICPRLREAGHGTLSYNLRGQADSRFGPDVKLTAALVVEDAIALFNELKPARPIYVGLSIGGLFAAQTHLAGCQAKGLVLLNTLREDSPRLRWINDAMVRTAEVGGLELFRDLFLPLLMNQDWLEANRGSFLTNKSYEPLDKDSGHYKLLAETGRGANWDFAWGDLALPVLSVTGLQDHVFLEMEVVDRLFAELPNAKRVDLPGCGHLIPAERPAELADILLKFAKEM